MAARWITIRIDFTQHPSFRSFPFARIAGERDITYAVVHMAMSVLPLDQGVQDSTGEKGQPNE